MTGPQHEEIHAVDTNANPTGKGGLSDPYSIAGVKMLRCCLYQTSLGMKHGFCYTDSCKGNDVGSVLRIVC